MAYQPKITEAKPVFHRVKIRNQKKTNGEDKHKSILVGFRVRVHSGHEVFYSKIHRTISVTEPAFQITDEFGRPKVDATGHPVMVGGEKVTGYRVDQFRRAYAHSPNFVAAAFLGFALAEEKMRKGKTPLQWIGEMVRTQAA